MTTTAPKATVSGLLTPAEVAALYRVDPKTVTRWSRAGRLRALRTLGGHRRFSADEVRALLDGDEGAVAQRASSGVPPPRAPVPPPGHRCHRPGVPPPETVTPPS